MTLTDKDITEYQMLYRQHYGVEIGPEEAYEQGINLLFLMSLVYRPFEERKMNVKIYEKGRIY